MIIFIYLLITDIKRNTLKNLYIHISTFRHRSNTIIIIGGKINRFVNIYNHLYESVCKRFISLAIKYILDSCIGKFETFRKFLLSIYLT